MEAKAGTKADKEGIIIFAGGERHKRGDRNCSACHRSEARPLDRWPTHHQDSITKCMALVHRELEPVLSKILFHCERCGRVNI